MDTASREAASRKARLAGDGCSIAKRCNTADGRFPTRPEGATQNVQYGVAALVNGTTIACELRLVLNVLGGSVLIKATLTEY